MYAVCVSCTFSRFVVGRTVRVAVVVACVMLMIQSIDNEIVLSFYRKVIMSIFAYNVRRYVHIFYSFMLYRAVDIRPFR